MSTITAVIAWLSAHDMPNTLAFVLTSIVWPLALLWWNTRWVRSVRNLQLSITPGKMTIESQSYDSVDIGLLNNTGKVVYVTQACLFPRSSSFPVHVNASCDLANRSHELKFSKAGGGYELRQVTIQTGDEARTALALNAALDASVREYTSPWWRRLLRYPKFFRIEYIVMVGDKRYKVSLIH